MGMIAQNFLMNRKKISSSSDLGFDCLMGYVSFFLRLVSVSVTVTSSVWEQGFVLLETEESSSLHHSIWVVTFFFQFLFEVVIPFFRNMLAVFL